MKFEKVEYYEVDYSEVETLFKEFFNDEYFCLAEHLDAHNGVSITLDVTKEDDNWFQMELAEAKARHRNDELLYTFGVGAVMEHYARLGVIPFGKYVIQFDW